MALASLGHKSGRLTLEFAGNCNHRFVVSRHPAACGPAKKFGIIHSCASSRMHNVVGPAEERTPWPDTKVFFVAGRRFAGCGT